MHLHGQSFKILSVNGQGLDDVGVFQRVLDARCTGPRDANWH